MGASTTFSTVFLNARVETIDGQTAVTCAEHAGAYVRMVGAGHLRTYFCEPNGQHAAHVLYMSLPGAGEEELARLKLRTEQELLPVMYGEQIIRPGQPEHEA